MCRRNRESTTQSLPLLGKSIALLLVVFACLSSSLADEDEIPFSGPQPGEKLPALAIRQVLGEQAGKAIDPVTQAGGKPLVLIFIHRVTRPTVALSRAVLTYAHRRQADGLTAGLILLGDDATATETWARRASHALPQGVPIGVSLHGSEGPGAYGLNRNVELTVLVGKDNKVTANFALVQPSLQADATRIAQAIVDVLGGGKVPTLEELTTEPGSDTMRNGGDARGGQSAEDLRPLLAPLIALNATPADVDAAAARVEAAAKERPAVAQQIGDIARRIIDAGKLTDYGTPPAQQYLKKWAAQFTTPARDPNRPPAAESPAKDHREE
jgi:hypothetical protein